jgi:hypothetical protein
MSWSNVANGEIADSQFGHDVDRSLVNDVQLLA